MTDKFLTRDEILAAVDIGEEVVEVPEWGGKVRIRGLDGKQRDRYQASLISNPGAKDSSIDLENATAKLVALCAVDAEGKALFSMKDVQALGAKSGAALNRCYEAASQLSGLSKEDIKELTGNFTNGQSEDSISD